MHRITPDGSTMFRLHQLYVVLLVTAISAQTGAVPQMSATQNAMEQELSNILETATSKSGVNSAEKKSSLPKVTAADPEMSSMLGAVEQASQAPQTEMVLKNLLQAAVKKSSIPLSKMQSGPNGPKPLLMKSPIAKSHIAIPSLMDEQSKQIATLMRIDAEAARHYKHRMKQLKLKESKPAPKVEKPKESVINSTANSTAHVQNATLSNATVDQTNSSTPTANMTMQNSTASAPKEPAPAQAAQQTTASQEPKKKIPHFKTKKDEAKWKMNEARKILQQAKLATEQALEYARERNVHVNKDNKNDVDEIIKKAEIALVHVGDHIGMEYKHYKK